jgi:hypothetical protein
MFFTKLLIKLRIKFANYIFNSFPSNKKFDEIKYLSGQAYFNIARKSYGNIKKFDEIYFKVFSQNGEDGIIDFLIQKIKIEDLKFVELGVGKYMEANTRYLFTNRACKGLIIDREKNLEFFASLNVERWKGALTILNTIVNKENINEILSKNNFINELDLLSIDLDGNDYWIVNELPNKFSKIAIIEYNSIFGSSAEITVPYDKNFNRYNYHFSSLCYGASLKAILKLMQRKGFSFLGVNEIKNNAFFINNDFSDLFNLDNNLSLDFCTSSNIQEAFNKKQQHTYLPINEARNLIKDCEVFDLKDNSIKKIRNI